MALHRRVRASRTTCADKSASRTRTERSDTNSAVVRTDRWRRDGRLRALRRLVRRTNGLRFSAELFDALMDELFIGDEDFTALMGRPEQVVATKYPQAIAVALALRHSWNDVDYRDLIRRLRLPRR